MKIEAHSYKEGLSIDQAVGKLTVYAETDTEADFVAYVAGCCHEWLTNREAFEGTEKPSEDAILRMAGT